LVAGDSRAYLPLRDGLPRQAVSPERGAGARREGGNDHLFEFIVPAVLDARRWASRIADATEGPAGAALAPR